MSPIAELPGSLVGRFRLIQRLGGPRSGVWKAEDPATQKQVVVRILTRSLPPDEARRAALLERVRQRAAFSHPAIPAIESVQIEGDALLVREPLIEGTPLTHVERPLEGNLVAKLAFQLADALRALHGRGIVHGAVHPDHVLVAPDGAYWLTGISLAALTARDDRGEERLLHSDDPSDLRELAYRAPEQISSRGTEVRSDVFSLGALLYEAATGRAPFGGAKATDIATSILRGMPPSPLELNPRVPIGTIAIIGKCLMKDPIKRFQDMQQVIDELRKAEPKIESIAARPALAHARRQEARTTEAPFILGVLPYFDLLDREDPEKASRLAGRMQQSLGESALLADGSILDSLGARFLATFGSAGAALDALRGAARDLAAQNATGEPLEPTILAHHGSITIEHGIASGAALDVASKIVASMEPGQILVTAPVIAALSGDKPAPAGSAHGVTLFPMPPEPAPEPAVPAESEPPAAVAPPPKKRVPLLWIGAAAAVFLAAISALLFWPRSQQAAPPVAAAPATSSAAADSRPELVLEPFSVDGTDPAMLARAAALEDAVRAMLATSPDLRLLDAPADQAARRYGTRSVPGGTSDQIMVYSMAGTAGETGPLSLSDPAAAGAIASWIAQSAGAAPDGIAKSSPDVLSAFVDALTEKRAGSADRSAAAIRKAVATDPDFLPAARAAVTILSDAGDRAGARAAAENAVRLDPDDLGTRRLLVTWCRDEGDAPAATKHAAAIISTTKSGQVDPETIEFVARQALGAGDAETFQRLITQLQRSRRADKLPLHAADAMAARGQLAVAVQQYYEIEPRERQNPFLALKIGRIDVLRHSIPAAELELEKLRLLDATYAAELLQAYLAAERRDAAGAAASLARAAAAPNRGPDFHTAEAEVYAILSDHRGLLSALDRAVASNEPTFAYILANPLFAYLREEEEFAPLRARMESGQQAVRAALAPLK